MKKYISLGLVICMCLLVTITSLSQETTNSVIERIDNPVSSWAQDSVESAMKNSILEKDDVYFYQKPICREQFCELIYNLIHTAKTDEILCIDYALPIIEDTDNIKISELYARGIVKGKSQTSFAPMDFLTREEAATIIERVVKKELPVPMHEVYYIFSDSDLISDWAKDGVQAVCNIGVMKGTGNNEFHPKELFTAEEAIVALMRIFDTYRLNQLNNISGIWVNVERDNETMLITNDEDAKKLKEMLTGLLYINPPCDGIITHRIEFNGISYGVLEDCKEIIKDGKQAKLTDEELETIMNIIARGETFSSDSEKTFSFADTLNSQMPKDENYMFSPISIKMALSMAANGALGDTQSEILNVLGISDIDEFNNTSEDIIKRYSQTEILSLNVANSVWINKGKTPQSFKNEFMTAIEKYYNAEANAVGNHNAKERINAWVNDKTEGKIPKIIENADDFWAMLINAIYFKGAWEEEFSEAATKPDIFHSADGAEDKIDFMNKTDWLSYSETEHAKIVELPYKNRVSKFAEDGEYLGTDVYGDIDVGMYLIMSDYDINVEEEFKKAADNGFKSKYIKLSVPKFKIEYSQSLNDILKNAGIVSAFGENAEFQNMFDGGNMWFTNVLHKTYISIDEKGTEAAAVTAIGMAGSALPPEPTLLKFNKPFYFVIRDNINGEILFMGRFVCGK